LVDAVLRIIEKKTFRLGCHALTTPGVTCKKIFDGWYTFPVVVGQGFPSLLLSEWFAHCCHGYIPFVFALISGFTSQIY
jgi:hypothetical protein